MALLFLPQPLLFIRQLLSRLPEVMRRVVVVGIFLKRPLVIGDGGGPIAVFVKFIALVDKVVRGLLEIFGVSVSSLVGERGATKAGYRRDYSPRRLPVEWAAEAGGRH